MTRRRCIVAVAAVVLAVGACADDDDDATPATTAVTVVAPSTAPVATSAATSATSATTVGTNGSSVPPASAPATSAATATYPAQTGGEPAVVLTEVGSFEGPVDLAWRPGDEAMYVVQQSGTVARVDPAGTTTVLDVAGRITSGGERGLLGLAFDPTGALAYVNFTDDAGATVIEEHAVDDSGTFAAEGRPLLRIEQPYANHNGGDLTFGPDGMLYIGTGDGGSGGDPERRATNPADLLGKMLRIDPRPSGGDPYTVPSDNPFVDVAGARPEIWSTGLRNPWRFSFDRQTGDLWIADVGQNAIEEVDVAPATGGLEAGRGLYFGWSALEGNAPYNADVSADGATPPIATYDHGTGCSVSGGARARGAQVPDLVGWYVYGDYCAGELWALEVVGEGPAMAAGRQVTLGDVPGLTAVVDGPDGAVYALSHQGPIVRLDPAA